VDKSASRKPSAAICAISGSDLSLFFSLINLHRIVKNRQLLPPLTSPRRPARRAGTAVAD